MPTTHLGPIAHPFCLAVRPAVRPAVRTVVLGAVAVLLTACGTGSEAGGATVTASTGTASTGAATTSATPSGGGTTSAGRSPSPAATSGSSSIAAVPAPTNTRPVTNPAGPTAPAAVLRAIRTADHGTYDRVVFEFDRPFGGYTVKYVSALTEDPTGDPVELAGGAVLAVNIQGATLDNSFQTDGSNPRATYGGPRQLTPNLPAVKEVADAGDFEAVLTFGIGVASKTGFRVLRLSSPDRLVVDVAH